MKSYISIVWHQHQPLYRNPLRTDGVAFEMPWTRLHAARDYYQMAHLVDRQPGMYATFNLTPVLLEQIQAYVLGGERDYLMELSLRDKEKLTPDEKAYLINESFHVDHKNQISGDKRYEELYEKLFSRDGFSGQDLRDLTAVYNLSWIGYAFRDGGFELETGETFDLLDLFNKPEGFTQSEIDYIIDAQIKIAAGVIPIHKRLAEHKRIELITSPYYHPILPLLYDSGLAIIDRPGTNNPSTFNYPQDVISQIENGLSYFEELFGFRPRGMWPSEGAVGEDVMRYFADAGIEWVATDEGVLARSGEWGYDVTKPETILRPYASSNGSPAIFFRHLRISDDIGFVYQHSTNAKEAAREFVANCENVINSCAAEHRDEAIISVILDGENCWGTYEKHGVPFLKELYRLIVQSEILAPVTPTDYFDGDERRNITRHPIDSLERVHNLAYASWIDEAGSDPGNDLGTWAGESEENLAWEMLRDLRVAVDKTKDNAKRNRAMKYVAIAEGSDWFWWFGDDHGGGDMAFDELFRNNIIAGYRELGIDAPVNLSQPIAPLRVVWSEQRPIEPSYGELLVVKWDEPGVVRFGVNGWQHSRELPLNPTAGVMGSYAAYFMTPLLVINDDVTSIEFTFRDTDGNWLGRGFNVNVNR